MASMWPPKKNAAFTLCFSLYKNDGTIIANPGTYTRVVSVDGGPVDTTPVNAVTEEDTTYGQLSWVLDAAEMNGDWIYVQCKDDTAGCVPFTCTLYPVANTQDEIVAGTVKAKVDVDTIKTQTVTCAAGVTVLASVGTAATSTAQTGDSYPLLSTELADLIADIGTNGAGLTALPWNAAWDAEVQSECADALTAYDPPTKAELDTAQGAVTLANGAHGGAAATLALGGAGGLTGAVTGNLSGSVGSVTGAVGSVTGAVGSVTGAVGSVTAGVTVTTNNDKTGYALADATSDAVIADAVWNAATATYGSAGSYGEVLEGVSAAAIADAVWDEDVDTTHQTAGTAGKKLDDAGGAADPWATAIPGAYGAGTAGLLLGTTIPNAIDAIDNYVDTEVGALTTELAKVPKSDSTVTWNATALGSIQSECTDALNAYDPPTKAELDAGFAALASDVDIADAVWNELSTGHVDAGKAGAQLWTDIDAILVDTGTTLDGKEDQIIAAVITNAAGTDVAADIIAMQGNVTTIMADTDLLDDVSGGLADIHTDVAAVKSDTAAILADTGTDGVLLAAAAVDAVWDEDVDAAHQTAGTAGKKLDDAGAAADPWDTALPGAYTSGKAGNIIGNLPTLATAVDAIWDEDVDAAHQTAGTAGKKLDDAGAAADPWGAAEGAAVYAATVTNAAGVDIAADIIALKAVADIIQADTDLLDDAAGGLADIHTDIAAINAKTTNLPASPAAVGSAMTLASGAITAAVVAADAIDADSLATDAVTEIVHGLLNHDYTDHTTASTFGKWLNAIKTLIGHKSVENAGGTSVSYKATDDVTEAGTISWDEENKTRGRYTAF